MKCIQKNMMNSCCLLSSNNINITIYKYIRSTLSPFGVFKTKELLILNLSDSYLRELKMSY